MAVKAIIPTVEWLLLNRWTKTEYQTIFVVVKEEEDRQKRKHFPDTNEREKYISNWFCVDLIHLLLSCKVYIFTCNCVEKQFRLNVDYCTAEIYRHV